MRVIKIDVERKEIYETDIENSLNSFYQTIGNGCSLIETATILPSKKKNNYGDVIYVDEECFMRVGDVKGFFSVTNGGTFANNGIIVGSVMTDNGVASSDCTWDLKIIRDLISFHERP
jgi:hypothetical protein